MKNKPKNAIALLKEDHRKVKEIFQKYEKAGDEKREALLEEALQELRVHTVIEEEIFYPAAEEVMKKKLDLLREAEEEHRVAKTIIEDLVNHKEAMDDQSIEAKFWVLAENVRHHIKEEEEEMFPEILKTDLNLERIGERLAQRKQELLQSEDTLKEAEEATHVEPYQELAL